MTSRPWGVAMSGRYSRFEVAGIVAILALGAGCKRGGGRGWLRDHGVAETRGALPMGTIDCPDGLARCAAGTVEVSRLATIAQPCRGRESDCSCPWERSAPCANGCAAEGVEVVVERARAAVQLCMPDPDAGFVGPATAPFFRACDETELYRCTEGAVVDCAAHGIAASCIHGCVAEGAAIDGAGNVTREAAFAILCSR